MISDRWYLLVWGIVAIVSSVYIIFRLKRLPSITYAYRWHSRPVAFWIRLVLSIITFLVGLAMIVMVLTGVL